MRLASITVAMLSVAALAALASAGQRFDSRVTIDFQAGEPRSVPVAERRVDAFGGEVESNESACVESRKVILYKQKTRRSEPRKVGSDRAAATGQWGVEASPAPNARFYFARIKEAATQGGPCEPDRSRKLEFPTR